MLWAERQSAQMSKITNRSSTGCFLAVNAHMTTVGVKVLCGAAASKLNKQEGNDPTDGTYTAAVGDSDL